MSGPRKGAARFRPLVEPILDVPAMLIGRRGLALAWSYMTHAAYRFDLPFDVPNRERVRIASGRRSSRIRPFDGE